jgi:hypothetical protein
MGRTAVNVTGQSLVATVVAKRAGIWEKDVWDAAEGSGVDLDSDEDAVSGADVDPELSTAATESAAAR